MRLRDTVHSLYLTAIALLPCQGGALAGLSATFWSPATATAPWTPVANITVNSIGAADRVAVDYDILDTFSLLCTEVHSLEGIMDIVRAMDPSLSTKDAVRSLCLTQCDITEMLQQSATRSSPGDLFLRAAVAARHPLPAALALFHEQLAADAGKLDSLRSVISTATLIE
jgi:hypothetical protein